MKKLLAILLSAVLVVGCLSVLSACGGEEEKGEEPAREGGYYPNITLSLSALYYSSYQETFDAKGWDLVRNPVCDYIRKELGIKFKLAFDSNDIVPYLDKLSAKIYAGELADIANLADAYWAFPMLKAAEKNGLLTDLTSYIKGEDEVRFSDDVLAAWETAGEEIFYAGTFNGRIKMLPWLQDSRTSTASWLFIREDWLDTVGKRTPTTIDELTDVMRAFKNMNDASYGLVVDQNFVETASIFNAYGVTPFYWYETDGGELRYGLTDAEPMKDAIAQLREWYVEGLINCGEENDIEVVGSLPYAANEVITGKAGMVIAPYTYNIANETIKRNPEARFTIVPMFAADGYEMNIATASNCFMYYVVGKDCKYPEAVVKVYNICMELYTDESHAEFFVPPQIERYDGNTVDGWYPIQFCPMRNTPKPDVEAQLEFIDQIQRRDAEGLNDAQLKTFNDYWDAVDGGFTKKNYANYLMYKEGGVYDLYYGNLDSANYVQNKFAVSNTAAMDKYLTDINCMVTVEIVAIIKGDYPVDHYDTVVKSWYEQGGEEITGEVNDWWKTVKVG